jgi:phosphodiesterase/alkaline phosphatase D-like protein
MNRRLLTLAITATVSSLILSNLTAVQPRPTGEQAGRVPIIDGPALESVTDHSAIIRWTTNPGGGSVVHYGVVQYGTDPENLSQTAKSPNRWNKNLPYMIYRVRVDGLQPGTTFYYTVESVQADGTTASVKSPVNQFTTRQHP